MALTGRESDRLRCRRRAPGARPQPNMAHIRQSMPFKTYAIYIGQSRSHIRQSRRDKTVKTTYETVKDAKVIACVADAERQVLFLFRITLEPRLE